MEIVVKVTQNWSFWNCQNRWPNWRNRGPILSVVSTFPFDKNRWPKGGNQGPILPTKNKTESYFWA